jgi:hypothetical protein
MLTGILNNDTQIIRNTKKLIPPYEIDFYIPNKNIAIEVNGIYWHSYKFDDNNQNRELTKSLLLADKNIHLLHIFEDSIIEKEDIVKSIIKAKLGIYDNIIYARNTYVKNITNDKQLVKDLLSSWHLYGYHYYDIALALYDKHDNKPLSIITFRHLRDKTFLIDRYAISLHTQVVAGFRKLMSYFLTKYRETANTVHTYLHIELNNRPKNSIYALFGFNLHDEINEDFYCVYNNKRYHRLFCNKDNLLTIAKNQGYDINKLKTLTQKDLALLLGIRVINLGSWKFTLDR